MGSTLVFFGLLLASLLGNAWSACEEGSSYAALSASHTMCQEDRGVDMPLTAEDIKKIVDTHNQVRAAVSPPAANMRKLVWDEDLAKTAAKLARLCTGNHDEYAQRAEPKFPGVSIGQNIAMSGGYSGMDAAITNSFKMGWLDEKADFTYGQTTTKTVGHYTQMINADTGLIGCGMADCKGKHPTYNQHKVCNYAPGQWTRNVQYPYETSTDACSSCPGKCENNLCDCGNKLCVNGGTLNLADCKCKCQGVFSGDTCAEKSCPEDKSDCSGWWDYYKNPCVFSNVQADCPNRCGLC